MRWKAILVIGILLFSVVAAGCISSTESGSKSPSPTKEITVKDLVERTVTVKVPVQRAVVLSTSALEIVQLLNASNQVVGIPAEAEEDAFLSPALKNKTVVGRMLKVTDWEKLLSLKPDLIMNLYLKKFYNVDEFLNKSASYDIPVIMLREDRLEDVPKAVELFGKVFGREKKAEEFATYFNEQVSEVKAIASKIPSGDRKKVLMIQPIMGKYYIVNGNDVLAQAVRLAGGDYMANISLNGYTPVRVPMEEEKIIANYKEADVVILLTSAVTPYDQVSRLKKTMLSDEAWNEIKAVNEGHIVILRADMGKDSYLRWSPRLAVGIWQIGKAIYPNYYPDWKKKAKEFVREFYPFLS